MMITGRIMALDVGDCSIGIALSDEMRIIAQPLKTLRYKGEHEFKHIFSELAKIIEEQNVGTVVVGLPLNMNGSEGPQAKKVLNFVERFKKNLTKNSTDPENWEWVYWDERLSTAGAERHLIDADVSRSKRKRVIDTMAAVFILQGYLGHYSRK